MRSLLLLVLSFLAAAPAQAQTKLLRFPDLHGDRIVFCYGGDLWSVGADGGTASRLTAHPGQELFPRFSPDGRWIAFTGQYDGDEQVYVMSADGGVPKQLTYYPAEGPMPPRWGYDNHVYGWTPDGRSVLFRSYRDSWDWGSPKLYTVPVAGGLPQVLPMPTAGGGAISADGKRVAYSPLFRDFRSWKRYEGGWAQDLFVFDLETNGAQRITEHVRTDRDPMWVDGTVWFASDRDNKLNLYRHDGGTKATQVTRHTDWDVRWPSAAPDGRIVYELGGELRVLDTRSAESRAVEIHVPNDGVAMRPARIDVSGQIEDYDLSPKGERALFVARGDVFTVPTDEGVVRNLTHSSNAHEREAAWSPDGKHIAYVSDVTGEEELWVVPQDGSGEARKITRNTEGRLYDPLWSPDAKRIAYVTKDGVLKVVDVATGATTDVHQEPFGRMGDHAWSPNGGWLAFSSSDPSQLTSIYLWEAASKTTTRVTGEYFSETNPVWDPGGEYLYYLADHSFAPQIGSREWNYALDRETGLFALALRKDVAHPFPPKNDEVQDGDDEKDEKDEKKDEEGAEKDDAKTAEPIRIDLDGLAERIVRVPIEADNLTGLAATDTHLLYVRTGPFYYGRGADVQPELFAFDLEEREAKSMANPMSGYVLSGDGKHVLVSARGSYALHDVGKSEGESVSTSGLVMDRVPAEEWATVFDEVWRRFRDYFYAENMHGYDWEALREQYRPLLEHVAHRSDLNYLLSELIGELAVSHAYIAGGDFELPERQNVALLGARFELDEEAGRYRIASIFPGQNDEGRYRSPLTEVGVDVGVGDYVLAINGRALTATENPFRLLRIPSGSPVELLVNGEPKREGARTVLVEPIGDENDLVYNAWVAKNRDYVTEKTGGRVGYLHVPDMGSNGIREFVKWYYGQVRKEGLVVDVRYNGGGNVSQMLIERLGRRLLGLDYARTNSLPTTYPSVVFHGHMVCLLNETSASDGDIFPWTFQKAGLGPLIGKRSWGGIIGISGHGPLLDGGSCSVPQYGNAGPEGNWVVEGYGVDPDIEVDNDVASLLEGRDNQLDRAIAEVLARMESERKVLPARPADPVKSY